MSETLKVVWKRGDETKEKEFRLEQTGEIVAYNVEMYVNGWTFVRQYRTGGSEPNE